MGKVKAMRKIFAIAEVPKKWAKAFSLANPKHLVNIVINIKTREVFCIISYFKIPNS